MTSVLRLIMNDGFRFDFSIACSEFFRISWVNRWWSPPEVQQNVTTKFAHVHEQSEFTYGSYLVAAEHRLFQRRVNGLKPASTCLRTVPRAQAFLRGRAWVAQLWAKSVGAVRLRALPFSLVQQGCLRFGVSRCGPAAAVVGRGC